MSKLGVKGVSIPGVLGSTLEPRGPNVLPLFEFDIDETVFTPSMAKRTSPGPFETAPIAQGNWDGTGNTDVILFSRGNQLGNPTKVLYSNFDPYQGSIVFWITPEWNGDDGLNHFILTDNTATLLLRKASNNTLFFSKAGQGVSVDVSAWTAGTTYCIVVRWDEDNAIDGTNYASLSINGVDTFGAPTEGAGGGSGTAFGVGMTAYANTNSADAIIEGLTIYRRVLYDGTYGTDVNGGLDELTAIYAAGAGVDPTTITGSNDVVFCLPTDSTAGALVTGTGEAWSHPLGSSIVDDTFMDQGMIPGGDWAIGFDGFDVAGTIINCGSDASLDDQPSGAAVTWGGWFKVYGDGDSSTPRFFSKSNGSTGFEMVMVSGTLSCTVYCDTTNASFNATLSNYPTTLVDGKWHYIETTYDDAGARTVMVRIDGYAPSASTQVAGVGNYTSEAAQDFILGNFSNATRTLYGSMAWFEYSSVIRHAADFPNALPTAPLNDGNTIEAWDMEDGSGATTVAMVNTPANDGTITSGTWEAVWNRELTPVEKKALNFLPSTTVNCGSDVDLDNLPTGAMTVEFFGALYVDPTKAYARIWHKGASGSGWDWWLHTSGLMGVVVNFDTDAVIYVNVLTLGLVDDGVNHHWMFTYDNGGDRFLRLYCDGILLATSAGASAGAYNGDAASNMVFGNPGNISCTFRLFWARLSNSVRYSNTFVPIGLSNPPADDANAIAIYQCEDGTGTTLTNIGNQAGGGSGAANRNGTITLGSGQWLNTPDMEVIEPGARMFHSGKVYGSDQALDGIKIQVEPTNPVDGVLLPRISYGQSGRARPIVVYNGTQFKYPKLHGTHTGGAAIPCEDTDGAWSQHIKGWTLYNITQGTSGVPTAIDGDGQGVTGGPNFNNGDEYIWRPPNGDNYCQHPIGTYGIWVLRTAAAVVELQIVNGAGEGSIQVHQMEVQESLLANGDHESLTGANPDIITAWANQALDPGDTQASSGGGAVIHSGAEAMQWNAGALAGEGMTYTITTAVSKFVSTVLWTYGNGANGLRLKSYADTQMMLQATLSGAGNRTASAPITAVWSPLMRVWRRGSFATAVYAIEGGGGASLYSDDAGAILMDDITLTVTPASEANSLEGTGIRVDGSDTATQPILPGQLQPSIGHIRFGATFRHSPGEFLSFGNSPAWILEARFDVNRRILFYMSNPSILWFAYQDGVGAAGAGWNPAGVIIAGTRYVFDIIYTPAWARLYIDGVMRINLDAVPPLSFTAIPNVASWGSRAGGDLQADVVIG